MPELKSVSDARFLSHAEAEALIKAYKKFGRLPEVVELFVDRPTCSSCREYLGTLARYYGATELRIYYSGQAQAPLILSGVSK